jgi:hypothetical protein
LLVIYSHGKILSRKQRLATLQKKLELMGGRKVPYKGAWYWVLKEEYTVGEEFEL